MEKSIEIVRLQGGLLITPYHPLKLQNDRWVFPCQLAPVLNIPVKAVYNFVLDSGHVLTVNGYHCATLAHEIKEPVVTHDYFGT